MAIKETDFDSMTNAVRYLSNAELWLFSAATTLDTTAKYTLNKNPRVVEVERMSKSVARLNKKLVKLMEEMKSGV